MKRHLITAAAALALATSAPLAAQDTEADAAEAELEEVMDAMSELFPRVPLNAEEESRLPQAQRIIALIIPEGTMGEIMGKMIDDIVRPMMAMAGSGAKTAVAKGMGVTPFELDLDEEQAAELAALFDPVWAERQEREFDAFPDMMREMMVVMEPPLRKAMSEAYAVRFTTGELTDIEAFFATETGAKYARESFAMASDPRMMGASMEALPALMGAMGDIEARMAEAVADLPPERGWDDLSEAEKARVLDATGFTEEEVRAALEGGEFYADDAEYAEEAVEEASE